MLRVAAYGALLAAVGIVGYMAYSAAQEKAAMHKGQDRLVANHGLVKSADKRLASDYADRQADLLADPPSDHQQLIDPERLLLAHYEGDSDDDERVDWPALQAALSQVTGKPVDCQAYLNSGEEIAAVAAGRIHIVAVHAADVPYLVNNAGFIPTAVLGTDTGASGNHLVIAAGTRTKIKTLTDLRNSKLTCTRPNSITGYRAAIVVLSQQGGLLPNVDYEVHFSLGQKRSIRGLVDGEFTVAALSADKLQSMLDEGEISKDQYRVIFESQVVPRLTFGHTHKLEPELAAKITAAALAFQNDAAKSQESPGAPWRFVPIDYKRDFEFVRQIDNTFDPRIDQRLATADSK